MNIKYNLNYNSVNFYKKGNKILIKKLNRGKFTEYCGGNVTNACILKGKNSSDPKIRKRATFAANTRTWKHLFGGIIKLLPKLLRKVPLELRAFKNSTKIFTPKKVELEAREGARDLMMWFKTPLWEKRHHQEG